MQTKKKKIKIENRKHSGTTSSFVFFLNKDVYQVRIRIYGQKKPQCY